MMKRFFTTVSLLFLLCASVAVLLAFQQTELVNTNETATMAVAPSLEDEIRKLRGELTEIQANREDEQRMLVPPGTVVAYLGNSVPKGWLLCDGQTSLDEPQYARLKELIGNKVPDYRGYFLRGLDPTGNVDPEGKGRTLISPPQNDTFANHNHTGKTTNAGNHNHGLTGGSSGCGGILKRAQDAGVGGGTDRKCTPGGFDTGGWDHGELNIRTLFEVPSDGDHYHTILSEGGKETRPKNVVVNWIIKY
jgi:hypothetical protein